MQKIIHTGRNWTKSLFMDNPKLYLPFLLKGFSHAKEQAESLSLLCKNLKISSPMNILDLSCGIGGHCIFLAKLGHKLVGYDPSEFYIQKARKLAKRHLDTDCNIKFYSGDLRCVTDKLLKEGESNFDLIISMGQSIGFGSVYDDIRMFKSLLPLSNDNTFLFVEFQNLYWVISNFQPNLFYQFNNLELFENWKFDLENSLFLNRSKFYERNSKTGNLKLILDIRMPQRFYSPHELKIILLKAGWNLLRCYKGVQKHVPATVDSMMPMAISRSLIRKT